MKKVLLKQITLTNFRGIKDKTIEFANETFIFGANATGKSTLFDAFTWLLFGKDQFNRKDYNITPVEDGQTLKKIDSEVSAIICVDDETISLKKIYHQKWTCPKGQAEEVFKGCDNLCYWNDVPLKVGEYQDRINSLVDETIFKLITNCDYFLSLKPLDQRTHLFEMAGSLSDVEIAAKNPDFKALLDNLSGKSLIDYKREINARKKKLKDDLEQIQPRVDQTRKLMPDKRDFKEVAKSLTNVEVRLTELRQTVSDKNEAQNKRSEDLLAIQKKIAGLRREQQQTVFDYKQKAKEEVFNKNQQKRDLWHKVELAKANISDVQRKIAGYQEEIKQISNVMYYNRISIDDFRQQWQDENAKEYIEKDGCLICPLYGHSCADSEALSNYNNDAEKAREAFNQAKKQKCDEIRVKGKELTKLREAAEIRLSENQTNLSNAESQLTALEEEYNALQAEYDNTPSISEDISINEKDIPQWLELQEQIKPIEEELKESEAQPIENTVQAFQTEMDIYEKKRDELKAQLAEEEIIERYEKEIAGLEVRGCDLAQQIADIERSEFLIAAFNKAKIEECEQRINRLFTIVNFQLFDKTIDGNEFETCIAKNKSGVHISATNTAEKVNAGLDIINALCQFHGITAPIFIDGRESVNALIPSESQIINLIVSDDQQLTINHE